MDQYCYENYGNYISHLHVLPGAEATLEAVVKALGGDSSRMAICTNCPLPITQQIVAKCPMLSRFFSQERTFCAGNTVQLKGEALRDPEGETRLLHLTDRQLQEATTDGGDAGNSATIPYQLQPKPCPDLIHYACSVLSLRADQCLFIGDSKFDLMSSVGAGCFSVGIGEKGKGGHTHVENIAALEGKFCSGKTTANADTATPGQAAAASAAGSASTSSGL